jgi:hypothetical protein
MMMFPPHHQPIGNHPTNLVRSPGMDDLAGFRDPQANMSD